MKRVIYDINPIHEAILQVKFPPILAINVSEPAEFQERIREVFPIYRAEVTTHQDITLSPVKGEMISSVNERRKLKNHMFISKDGHNKINLTQDFISLSTVNYIRWEYFIDLFRPVLLAFNEIFKPSFYTRIGLRYTDVLSREKLNLTDKPWSSLIDDKYLGAFALKDENYVLANESLFSWRLDDGISILQVHTGLAKTVPNEKEKFVIDSDVYRLENMDTEQFDPIISYLHNQSGRFSTSTMKDELKSAMHPEEIGTYD